MGLTLADRVTLARVVIAPIAAAMYLCLPYQYGLCFWFAGWACGLAETTDWLDGRIARARNEVSDFGKLADPFCDVFYRCMLFMVLLLPAGGHGIPVDAGALGWWQQLTFAVPTSHGNDLISMTTTHHAAGLMPWLPVILMVQREIVAGALRSMCATKGLVLAARMSGKVKAWMQGFTIIVAMGLHAVFGVHTWFLHVTTIMCWATCAVSLYSLAEYIWDNRSTLRTLMVRTTPPAAGAAAPPPPPSPSASEPPRA